MKTTLNIILVGCFMLACCWLLTRPEAEPENPVRASGAFDPDRYARENGIVPQDEPKFIELEIADSDTFWKADARPVVTEEKGSDLAKYSDEELNQMLTEKYAMALLTGLAYYNGDEVIQNYKTAFENFSIAIENLDYVTKSEELDKRGLSPGVLAAYYLSQCYHFGLGTSKNKAKAEYFLRLSAERGVQDAQTSLSISYLNGDGFPQDYIKAYAWANIAAIYASEKDAAKPLRDYILSKMTPLQIEEGQKLSKIYEGKFVKKREY